MSSSFFPLKAKQDVRPGTRSPGTLASALISSSVIPSLKYSSCLSALMLTNGSTAMDLAGAAPLTFWGPLRFTQLLRVEIDQRNDFAVFDLAFANFMQVRPPASVMLEIVSHVPREKNMSGISAIHHSLRDVDARTRDVRLFVQVGNFIYRATVDTHSHFDFGVTLHCFGDLNRAPHRRFG